MSVPHFTNEIANKDTKPHTQHYNTRNKDNIKSIRLGLALFSFIENVLIVIRKQLQRFLISLMFIKLSGGEAC